MELQCIFHQTFIGIYSRPRQIGCRFRLTLTLTLRAIIDWEYAGFFPARFDYPFYHRLGPSSAIHGEVDDSLELLQFLHSQQNGSS